MSPVVARTVRRLAKESGVQSPEFISFAIERPVVGMKGKFAALAERMAAPTAFHVVSGRVETKSSRIVRITMLVVKEENGRITSLRKLTSR
jgi:hypothetical protein